MLYVSPNLVFLKMSMLWIRIRIGFGRPDPDLKEKNYTKNREKINKFHVLKFWMLTFERSRLLLYLGLSHGSLDINKL
jgi:hypothetical protein